MSGASIISERNLREFVGAKLRQRRVRAGLSQPEMAQRIGALSGQRLSFQQWQKYERGSNRIDGAKLFYAAVIVGCNIADFFPPATKDANLEIETALASTLGQRLADAFSKIQEPQSREAAVFLIESIVKTEQAVSGRIDKAE